MDFSAQCTIRKNNAVVKELKQSVQFPDGSLTNYGDVIKKLQAEVNQALTDIVETKNAKNKDSNVKHAPKVSAQGDTLEDPESEDEAHVPETPRSPKRPLLVNEDAEPLRKHGKF